MVDFAHCALFLKEHGIQRTVCHGTDRSCIKPVFPIIGAIFIRGLG
jgi:hypothetical protein